jgi:hypothetical protein
MKRSKKQRKLKSITEFQQIVKLYLNHRNYIKPIQ